jgi:hypothetical protein
MIGHNRPSKILNELYNILEEYEVNLDTYAFGAFSAVEDYLKHSAYIPYQAHFQPWDNGFGGCYSIAFVEDGFPFLLTFEMTY